MKKLFVGASAVLITAIVIWTKSAWSSYQTVAKTAKFNEDVENLFIALQKFKEHVGTYPLGSNAEIAKALMGQNAKNIIILIGRKNEVNEKGEFVDPWGIPLRIYFSDNGVLVRSAGPNRRFDDSTVKDSDDFIRSN